MSYKYTTNAIALGMVQDLREYYAYVSGNPKLLSRDQTAALYDYTCDLNDLYVNETTRNDALKRQVDALKKENNELRKKHEALQKEVAESVVELKKILH